MKKGQDAMKKEEYWKVKAPKIKTTVTVMENSGAELEDRAESSRK